MYKNDDENYFRARICRPHLRRLVMTTQGPKLLEYNTRSGGPEAQTLLPFLHEHSDLAEIMLSSINNKLDGVHLGFKSMSGVSVVLASRGYHDSLEMGKDITIHAMSPGELKSQSHGRLTADNLKIDILNFRAGTKWHAGAFYTNDGRLITVVYIRDDFQEALDTAYKAVDSIEFDGKHLRKDIGQMVLSKMK